MLIDAMTSLNTAAAAATASLFSLASFPCLASFLLISSAACLLSRSRLLFLHALFRLFRLFCGRCQRCCAPLVALGDNTDSARLLSFTHAMPVGDTRQRAVAVQDNWPQTV
eukprot:PLAT14161.2.p1 GENE.PLAT14161.2~~PLAT14161.2.p1  ORF type:complete len:111 (-),score=14.22 PLAT14161.2:173-505(-)